MTTWIDKLIQVLKLPFVTVFKLIIFVLNLIPLPIYEVHGIRGTTANNRPDLRAIHTLIQGKKRLHLGSFFVAWSRGAIFKAHLNSSGASCWGIMAEDYDDIQKKWTF